MDYVLIIDSQSVLIDEDRYNLTKYYTWSIIQTKHNKYVKGYRRGSTREQVYLHRVILEGEGFNLDGLDVDHRDGDTLNNKRCNLRVATRSQNTANKGLGSTNKSGYKGVRFYPRTQKWRAEIRYQGEHIHLGYFDLPESAAVAYNHAAKQFFGEFAWLNNIPT